METETVCLCEGVRDRDRDRDRQTDRDRVCVFVTHTHTHTHTQHTPYQKVLLRQDGPRAHQNLIVFTDEIVHSLHIPVAIVNQQSSAIRWMVAIAFIVIAVVTRLDRCTTAVVRVRIRRSCSYDRRSVGGSSSSSSSSSV